MGLKEEVYRGETAPPPDRVHDVKDWPAREAAIVHQPECGLDEGDTGWIRVDDCPAVDGRELDRNFLRCRVHDTGDDLASVDVRDPAVHDRDAESIRSMGRRFLRGLLPD